MFCNDIAHLDTQFIRYRCRVHTSCAVLTEQIFKSIIDEKEKSILEQLLVGKEPVVSRP
jgi:hypothetical protein